MLLAHIFANDKSRQAGQSLIEVLVVLGMAIITMSSIVLVVLASFRNAQFAQNQAIATKYAQESLEMMRAARERDVKVLFEDNSPRTFANLWNTQLTASPSCFNQVCNFKFSDQADRPLDLEQVPYGSRRQYIGNGFSREIVVEDDADYATEKLVIVKVSWQDSSGTHESHLQTILTNHSP